MIEIKSIGSGSAGNSYSVYDGTSMLLLEAGFTANKILMAYGNISKIAGCLITHEHRDHATFAHTIANAGIEIFLSLGTLQALKNKPVKPLTNIVKAGSIYTVGSFVVIPFDVFHDAAEPLGFILHSNTTKESVLFVTDTCAVPYVFAPRINYILVEANFDIALFKERYSGELIRLKESHLEISETIKFLLAQNLTRTQHIYLIHLSSRNADRNKMVDMVHRATGIPTTTL